jgi:hypothetical protein
VWEQARSGGRLHILGVGGGAREAKGKQARSLAKTLAVNHPRNIPRGPRRGGATSQDHRQNSQDCHATILQHNSWKKNTRLETIFD